MQNPVYLQSLAAEQLRQAYACQQRGQFREAQLLFEDAIKRDPNHLDALRLAGINALRSGSPARAAELFGDALQRDQSRSSDYICYGVALCGVHRYEMAVDAFNEAIKRGPGNAVAYYNRANALAKLAQYEAAVQSYDATIALKPDHVGAFTNRGLALSSLGRNEAAIASYDQAIAMDPNVSGTYHSRGRALALLGRHEAAIQNYNRALELGSEPVQTLKDRGNSLVSLRLFADAVSSYDEALSLQPDAASIHVNRGNALQELRQHEAAVQSYDTALGYSPDSPDAYNNRGNSLVALSRHEAAVRSFDQAIALNPAYAEAYHNRGVLRAALWQREAALADFSTAIWLKPNFPEVYVNLAHALRDLKEYEAAIENYDKALALRGSFPFVGGDRLLAKLYSCAWGDLIRESLDLAQKVEQKERAASPFSVVALFDSLPLQRTAAVTWAQAEYPADTALPPRRKRSSGERLRIGYFSADFRDHPVGLLTAGLFEAHDRTGFEISGFSFGPDVRDTTRLRVEAGMQNFVDVREKSDQEVASLAREMGVDIAVDLGGFTSASRAGIFALRAAPVQVNFLGYPGTMGANWMDYLIADKTIIPASSRPFYAEKIAYIPSYQPNDSRRIIADREFSRVEMDLPDVGFVFCCFNNCAKITPAMFDVWMRILARVEGSVLWLSRANESARKNLFREASVRGISPERLVFAKHLASAGEHLARHRLADLFLDTLPYNAHTTASDALWAGLPLLTCMGQAFAGRVAASLLEALGIPELIALSMQEYEELAVHLALHNAKLAEIRQRLADNRDRTLLFDSRRYAKHLEAAYLAMYARFRDDLPPEHLVIESS